MKRPLPPATHASLHHNCDHRHLVYPKDNYIWGVITVKVDCAELLSLAYGSVAEKLAIVPGMQNDDLLRRTASFPALRENVQNFYFF